MSGWRECEGLAHLESLSPELQQDRPARYRAAMRRIFDYEAKLGWRLIDGLKALPGVRILGITEKDRAAFRVPTVSFVNPVVSPQQMAARLAEAEIFAWAGHSYAIEPLERLGLLTSGGVLRLGVAHYNTEADIDRTLEVIEAGLKV